MNLSRATTLAPRRDALSWAASRRPTLALLVEREQAIRGFVPEDYLEVVATFAGGRDRTTPGQYRGTWFRGERATPEAAAAAERTGPRPRPIVARVRRRRAEVESVESRDAPAPAAAPLRPDRAAATRQPPLRPRARRRRWPPRSRCTRSRSSSPIRAPTAGTSRATWPPRCRAVVARDRRALRRGSSPPGPASARSARRFVDDAKVTDHHAIIPTAVSAAGVDADAATSARVYDLVCRRLLMAWHDEHVFAVTTVVTRVESGGEPAPWTGIHSSRDDGASRPAMEGRLEGRAPTGGRGRGQDLPPGLAAGQPERVRRTSRPWRGGRGRRGGSPTRRC